MTALILSSKSDLRSLPAMEVAFYPHVLRALYQLMIFKRANVCNLGLPPGTEFGRKIVNGKLPPILMTKKAKSDIVKQSHANVSHQCAFPRDVLVKGQMYHVVPRVLALDSQTSVDGLAVTLLKKNMMMMKIMMHRLVHE